MAVNLKTYSNKKVQNRILFWIILSVIALHAVAIAIMGSIVIFRHFFKKETTFVAPPEVVKRIEPRKLEHKVKIQKQQQKSGRPRVQPRLSASKISELALPEIKTDIKPIKDSLKSTLRSFGANGVGTGTAGGKGVGGLGLGTSNVRFMGFSAQTERVAVVIDLSLSMLEDRRGGFDGFEALKSEIQQLIQSLSGGSFFNLIAFGPEVDIFQKEASIATKEKKREAKEWLEPYMKDRVNVRANGIRLRNYAPADNSFVLPNQGGSTRFDVALLAAFESGVDTIFVISDGAPVIFASETDQQKAARMKIYEKALEDEKANKAQREKNLEEYKKRQEKKAALRARRGLPPEVSENAGGPPRVSTAPPRVGDSEIIEYMYQIAKKLYAEKGKQLPKIYTIGYATNSQEETFLKQLAQKFKGRFRRAKALVKPIVLE